MPLIYGTNHMTYMIMKLSIVLVIVLSLGMVGLSSFTVVEGGTIGVLKTWGEISMEPQGEGLHIVIPMAQNITPMSIQIQKYESNAESASKDLQTVTTEVTVNYHLLADKIPYIFQNIGLSYEDRIINPAIEETVKQVTARFNAEELITKRPQVKSAIEESIATRLMIDNIMVDHISITEFTFGSEFNRAIEQKVKAEQDALTAQNLVAKKQAEALQRIAEAEGLAGAKIAVAEGEAQAIMLKGDAEAYKLSIIGEALKANPDLLTLENIQKWNGILPKFFMSSGDGDSPQLLLSVPTFDDPQ